MVDTMAEFSSKQIARDSNAHARKRNTSATFFSLFCVCVCFHSPQLAGFPSTTADMCEDVDVAEDFVRQPNNMQPCLFCGPTSTIRMHTETHDRISTNSCHLDGEWQLLAFETFVVPPTPPDPNTRWVLLRAHNYHDGTRNCVLAQVNIWGERKLRRMCYACWYNMNEDACGE